MKAPVRQLAFDGAALPEKLRLGAARQRPAFERVAMLAARGTGCPMALVTLLTEQGQWNVGRFGVAEPSLPWSSSICALLLPYGGLQVVSDRTKDARLKDLELIDSLQSIRFYAGEPVLYRGDAVGDVCVLDQRPRTFFVEEAAVLHDLSVVVGDLLDTIERQVAAQSERRRAEDFAAASGDWFWELDAEGRYAWISPNFASVTGTDPQRLLGSSPGGLAVIPRLLTEPSAAFAAVLVQRRQFSGVLVEMPLGRAERFVSLSAVVRTESDGSFAGFRGTARDVTDRMGAIKAAEQERLEREAAVRADAAKSAFLSRASHELRTPLNAIVGFTDLMLRYAEAPLPAKIVQQLQMVKAAGDHLLELVNDLLDLGKLQHAPPLELGRVSLSAAVTEAFELLQVDAKSHGVTLQSDIDAALAVNANASGLRRVLLNVLSNAIKHNREGGMVWADAALHDDDAVALVVRDTGVGIGPEHRKQLFQPFNRLAAENGRTPGSGLGLVIVRSLMREMKGGISIVDRRRRHHRAADLRATSDGAGAGPADVKRGCRVEDAAPRSCAPTSPARRRSAAEGCTSPGPERNWQNAWEIKCCRSHGRVNLRGAGSPGRSRLKCRHRHTQDRFFKVSSRHGARARVGSGRNSRLTFLECLYREGRPRLRGESSTSLDKGTS